MRLMQLSDLYEEYASGQMEKHKYIEAMHKKHALLFEYCELIQASEIESITILGDKIFVVIRGSKIILLLNKEDARFIPIEIINFKSVDLDERKLLASIMPSRAIVFDVGANIGWYSLNFAKMPKVKKVFAFEPIPYTYGYLKKHIDINLAHNIYAFNLGFSNSAGEKTFYWTKQETGSASMKNIQNHRKVNIAKCRISTIDKFMRNRRHAVDLIKCDVEGSELMVFKGAIKTLSKYQPIIYTEMLRKWSRKFGYHPNDIIDLLAGLGYRCYGFVGEALKQIVRVTPELATRNYFFFHTEKHHAIIKKLMSKGACHETDQRDYALL